MKKDKFSNRELERELCGHPKFGCSETLLKRIVSIQRLQQLARPDCHEKLTDRVLLDPVVRLDMSLGNGPLSIPSGLERADLFWKGNEPLPWRTSLQTYFEKLVAPAYPNESLQLVPPNEVNSSTFQDGQNLLKQILPNCCEDLKEHVLLLGWVSSDRKHSRFGSHSEAQFPGAIFWGEKTFRNPWKAAEAIFHESLHQKYFNTLACMGLLKDTGPPCIKAVWNAKQSPWNVHKSLGAFHVYVNLTLFFRCCIAKQTSLQRQFGDPKKPLTRSLASCGDRARYLGDALLSWGRVFTSDGLEFLNWLLDLLNKIDPNPPWTTPLPFLWLERYEKQTLRMKKINRLVEKRKLPSECGERLVQSPLVWPEESLALHSVKEVLQIRDEFVRRARENPETCPSVERLISWITRTERFLDSLLRKPT